jgi:GDP-L-fucose synthase
MSSFWTDKSVLVTGGAGFLGSHVVEALIRENCSRIYVVRSSEYDLTRQDQAEKLFYDHKSDIVVHLAGLVGGIEINKQCPAEFFYKNLLMGTFTLHYAWLSGVSKVVTAGAGCGYPKTAEQPLREDSFWDGFPQEESAPYSLAKRMLHIQSLAYWEQYKFPVIVTIPGNIYGPYDNFQLQTAHVIPSLVRKFAEADNEVIVWGSGQQTRDFVYAEDVARGILLAAEKYNCAEIVNLSSGEESSIQDVVENLKRISGFSGKVIWDKSKPEGQVHRMFSIEKAQKEIGFAATTRLYDGLKKTHDWYVSNKNIARR